jgi:hypothetical protein
LRNIKRDAAQGFEIQSQVHTGALDIAMPEQISDSLDPDTAR